MEPDSVNLDEVIDEPNPCLIVMNSQVEDPDNEDTRVRRLQQLAALKDSSSSNDQEKEQGKEEHREKEDDDSSDEDEVLFVPPSQADEMLEENAPSRANETLLQSFISTPSETVGILHLSGESSRILVPETSDDTLSTQQTSDEAHPIISSSPSDNTLADSSKEETKKEEDEEFQVPEWQRAINASEVEQRVSSSKEVSSASSSSATSQSVDSQSSNSAPSLQLLQNWQDPNQVDSSQSLIQQRDFAAQASASSSPQLIIDSQQLTDSVQIIGEVESGKSSHSTSESGATSGASRHIAEDIHGMENVTSSQDFRLHLTQSQTETEAEGVGVYMDAALKKEGSAGTHRDTLDQVSQTGPFSDDKRPHRHPKKHSDPRDISSSGLTSSSEKEKIERLASKEKSSTVESTKPSKSLDADERNVHEEIASKPKSTPQPTIQQLDKSQRSNQEAERSITPSSIAEVNSKDSLSESNTSQPSGLSFHLNMIKDNSRISPFEAQGGLLNSKKFQHSTPIVSEVEDEDQQGKNSEKEQSKSSSSKSLLTISEQDSIPAETEKEMTFHLNVPSKEEIQAIRESPTRKKVTVFSGIQQASFSKAKQVSLQDEKEESTQDEDPFASEARPEESAQSHRQVNEAARPEEHENELPDPLNLNRERENNSSTDTLPVELSAETEQYGMDLDKSVIEDTSRNAETVDHSVAMETEDVAEPRKPSAGKKKGRKRKQRGRASGSGDALSPSRHSKQKFTEVRDPYQFTDSQSNRVQSPLKQRGEDLMAVASKTKAEPDRLEKRKSPRSSRRRGASSAERERTRAENGVKEGGNKEEQKGDPSSEKENQGGVEQSGSKVTRSETRRNLSFVRQSSSSSSSGHQQHLSRTTLQEDPDMEIKYEVVNIHLKVKKVYIRGILAHTYTKELSKVVEPAESSESDEWPASPTSSFSGYLGDVSSMGSRSSSNTGSLQKSVSIGSKSSSSTTSLGKDSSPAKTPSPQVPPLQTGRSLNRTGSSSSSGKSSHGVVHFSPELEATLAKTSSVGGKDSEFKQPEKSVRKKSVSPKEGAQSESNLSRVTQGESQVGGEMGGLGKDLTKRTKVASVVNVTEETEVQVHEEESFPRKGRREKGEGSSKDKERSRQGLTLQDMSPTVTDSSRLTELPDPIGDKTALESAQAAEEESTWRQSESTASKQTRGRRRRGRRTTRGDGDPQEMSKQDVSFTESAPGMSGPREAPLEEKEAQTETVAGEAAFEILNSPPINTGPDQPQASTSWSEEILKPGTKVLCKWPQTSFYYPSIIQSWTRDDKYLVLYDDMSKREVARANIVCKEWLSKGQPVFVTTDKDFVDSAIVVGYFKDLKSKTVGYVVEDNKGNSKRVAKTQVLLNKEQATNLMNSSTSSSSDVTLENIISGRRSRRVSKKVQLSQAGTQETQGERSATAVTPSPPPPSPSPQQKRSTRSRSRSNNSTAEKSKASDRGKSKVGEGDPVSHSLMSVQLLEEADSMRLSSGSTPRSGVKRRQEEGSKDRDMPARKKLALGVETGRTQMESVTPRHSPRRVGSSTSSSSTGGPLPRSRVLFKGYAFLLTQVVKTDESQESFTREESHMSTPFNKELAKRQIAAGGGTVLRDLEKAQVFRGKVFLIADTHCRTKKYLLALAAGVPCVSHMWLNESCKTGRIPNFQDYILPAGESCEEDCIVEWHPNRYQIMAGIRVMVISSAKEVLETWRSILMAAGSDVVIQYSSTEIIKEKNFSFDCDVIVTDPSCPRSILRSARELSIPVVSAEWLYQCVINGRKVEYEGSHRYEWDYNGEHD